MSAERNLLRRWLDETPWSEGTDDLAEITEALLAKPKVYCTCNRHLNNPTEGCGLHGFPATRSRNEAEVMVDALRLASYRQGWEDANAQWSRDPNEQVRSARAALIEALTEEGK